jgi:hypothetical protein
MLSSSAVDRCLGTDWKRRRSSSPLDSWSPAAPDAGSGECVHFPTLWSDRSEPEGSIKGSIPTARWRSCKLAPNKKRRFAALLRSPLTDSNRRPPPYHFGVVATGGNPRQRISLVLAVFADRPFAADCQWLRLLGSTNAPSLVDVLWSHEDPLRERHRRSGRRIEDINDPRTASSMFGRCPRP